MRILKWIVERSNFGAKAQETSIGWLPRYEDIDWTVWPWNRRSPKSKRAPPRAGLSRL